MMKSSLVVFMFFILHLSLHSFFLESGCVEFHEFLQMYARKKKAVGPTDEEDEVRAAFKVHNSEKFMSKSAKRIQLNFKMLIQ